MASKPSTLAARKAASNAPAWPWMSLSTAILAKAILWENV